VQRDWVGGWMVGWLGGGPLVVQDGRCLGKSMMLETRNGGNH
jgi:hypothetical protein